jgi:predicted  nucleic acid-binding Zn-ribbon protein
VATESRSALGCILGFGVGFVLFAGLAASPFYLGQLQGDDRALDAAVESDVEAVRRVVVNLDPHLGAVADVNASRTDDERLTPEAADAIAQANPDLFAGDVGASLRETVQMLQGIERRDRERGTEIVGGKPLRTGTLGAGAAVRLMESEYLASNEKLQQTAQTTLRELQQVTAGAKTAGGHLAVTRAQMLYALAAARLDHNQAVYEQDRASVLRRTAARRLGAIATLRRQVDALEAQIPTVAEEDAREALAGVERELGARRNDLSRLRQAADTMKGMLVGLEETAAEARREMADLEFAGLAKSKEAAERYATLAAAARDAEQQAAALRNGTLRDAERVGGDPDDMLSAKYEGGVPQPGLRDVEFRLRQFEAKVEAMEGHRTALQQQVASISEQREAVESQLAVVEEELEAQQSEVERLLADADDHAAKAQGARTTALDVLKRIENVARSGVQAAQARSREAGTPVAAGAPLSECQELVKADGDTEATMVCLAAEIEYARALIMARRIEAIKDKAATDVLVAEMTGSEPTVGLYEGEIAELRTEATNLLMSAAKNYEKAEGLLKRNTVRTTSGTTVSGSNYLWQVQLGAAAVYLLKATITRSVDGQDDVEAQNAAYAQLTAAAQGREQSPLLTPAVEAILYLQQSVGR